MTIKQTTQADVSDPDITRPTHEVNILPCDMTKDEVTKETERLLETLRSMDELEAEKKTSAALFASRAKMYTQNANEARRRLDTNTIMRSVECTLLLNLTKLTATLTREDTDRVVNQRPLKDDERHMMAEPDLPYEEAPAEVPAEAPESPDEQVALEQPTGDEDPVENETPLPDGPGPQPTGETPALEFGPDGRVVTPPEKEGEFNMPGDEEEVF